MSAQQVNSLTYSILNQLYASQNATKNVALGGISLYMMLGALNVGLSGTSYDQLSHYLGDDFEDLLDQETWRSSPTARTWIFLRTISLGLSIMKSQLVCSCYLYDHYKRVTNYVFNLHDIQVDTSNPAESADQINKWISDQTFESIGNWFDESMISPDKIVLVDTFGLNAEWLTKFNEALTTEELFYDDNGQSSEVAMMNQIGFTFVYDSPDEDFKIMFKPFKEQNLYFVVMLPRDGYGVEDVLKTFKIEQMYDYYDKSESKYVKLKLPKLKLIGKTDLVETFKQFGITEIFNPDQADFKRMTNHTVFVENLLQITNVVIGEQGVTTAETTKDTLDESLTDVDEFYMTKPFLLFVYSTSARLVLFGAIVSNPNAT
ncbi:Serpin B11 [Thelohanellus kitauei]|uniref:Serpin B11 n=1 Tax=Thelohanellus kitauei TaxID=669202 RepID=A0A0C2JAR2_THEKT|nr:Serpin B11 [Thelohanellus kitauei]